MAWICHYRWLITSQWVWFSQFKRHMALAHHTGVRHKQFSVNAASITPATSTGKRKEQSAHGTNKGGLSLNLLQGWWHFMMMLKPQPSQSLDVSMPGAATSSFSAAGHAKQKAPPVHNFWRQAMIDVAPVLSSQPSEEDWSSEIRRHPPA